LGMCGGHGDVDWLSDGGDLKHVSNRDMRHNCCDTSVAT